VDRSEVDLPGVGLDGIETEKLVTKSGAEKEHSSTPADRFFLVRSNAFERLGVRRVSTPDGNGKRSARGLVEVRRRQLAEAKGGPLSVRIAAGQLGTARG
jgi:hypothetical protein